ncbi:MAG TPA: hypothetical protein VG387_12620 [Rhizomicrobium sp.]|jgi:hypothetical protein|nr:hypothetical protein [Rhizomicrobium sp.]
MDAAAADFSTRIGTPVLETLKRYALAALGPFTIAGAHFLSSILFLKTMAPAAFGLFAFVLVAVPFWLGVSVALFGAPMATRPREELPTLMKANALFCVLAGVGTTLVMAASGADAVTAGWLGVYGGVMCLRWFARWLAYTMQKPLTAVLSDVAYGALLVAGLAALIVFKRESMANAAIVLSASALAGLAVFGWDFVSEQARALRDGSLKAYAPIWRDLTQWALLGIVTSELSVNAHAYLVTLASGPKAFALIAAGSLFMRPVALCLTALPDRERPLMVETLRAGDRDGALRCVRDFRGAVGAIWLLTMALAAAALLWFPHLVLKADYDQRLVVIVVALWAVIMAVRGWRTPEAVLLQAARAFKPLAGASVWSSIVSVGATAILLWAFGPVASLLGILVGDIVLTTRVGALKRRWQFA